MQRIQKCAQICASDVMKMNAGLHVLRKAFEQTAPSDVQWWFTFSQDELTLCWMIRGRLDELRAGNFVELLKAWERIDWKVQREAARPVFAR